MGPPIQDIWMLLPDASENCLVMPDFGSRSYWQRELNDLEDQLERIDHSNGQALSPFFR